MMIDLAKFKVQMFLEGHFHTRIIFQNLGKPLYCEDMDIILEPKKN